MYEMLQAARHASLEAFPSDVGYTGAIAVEVVETVLRFKPHISEKIKDTFCRPL